MKCIYRLFIAGLMLRDIKVPNKGKFHNYPKVILVNLLILDYWRTQNHVVWKMMKSNLGILNEESGEQTFSLLGRSVLGDTILSQFDHMNKVYSLLPITRSIKGEIMEDQHSSTSISWRHTIHLDSDEVRATSIFFKTTIKEILANRFQSYDGSNDSYASRISAARKLTNVFTTNVYNTSVLDSIDDTFKQIQCDLFGFFLHPFSNIWPAPVVMVVPGSVMKNILQNMGDASWSSDDVEGDLSFGASWDECKVGSFAVVQTEMLNGKGICVYEVLLFNESSISDTGATVYSFTGIEYYCNKDNRELGCVDGGRWKEAGRGRKNQSLVTHWQVISYLDKLNKNFKLPAGIQKDVLEHNRLHNLFEKWEPADEPDEKHVDTD